MFLTFLTVVDLACGGAHTLAVGKDGGLYVWGSNSSGQVTALGGLLLKEFFEIKSLFDPNFSLALEPDPRFRLPQSGLVFRMARRWVLKRKLQTLKYFTANTEILQAIAVAAGTDFSLVLTESGRVFSCGDDMFVRVACL
jgi:alpha-tubulin suppressor-like RCC1 family protein